MPDLSPYNTWSPHEPGAVRVGRSLKPVPVQCNRPADHDGNHMRLSGAFERVAEWEPARILK